MNNNANGAAHLVPVGDDCWIVEGGIVDFYSFPYPTRSVVCRMSDGTLWVWSPIALSEDLRREVNELGQVAHLVSPNKIHHLFLGEWKEAYPGARLWGPQSVIDKRQDLTFQPALTDTVPEEWRNDIDTAWFRGSFFIDEMVFFHPASNTAIFADLSENFSEDFLREHWGGWKTRIAKLWRIVEGYGYAPLEMRLSWWRKKPAREALAKVKAWQPERVVMAHGEWQREGGLAFINRAFRWLDKSEG